MSVNEMRIQKVLREENDTKRLGILVKYMCLSLSCKHHQSLHGELFGIDEIKKLYDLTRVPAECRCGVIQILVDDHGHPLTPSIVEKARSQSISKNS